MSRRSSDGVRAQARSAAKTPEPFGVEARQGARSRSSSSSGTTRGGSTTTSASSATARSPPGRCRRACRSSPGQRALAVHVEDHPLDYATLRGRDPEGQLRRRHGRDLGQRHVRARRGEAGRRAHRAAARRAARGHVDARAGAPRRQREELAPHAQARRDGARRVRERLQADARDARRGAAARRRAGCSRSKWDGYRALGYVRGGEAQLVSRNGNDLTQRFPSVAKALAKALRSPDVRRRRRGRARSTSTGRPSFSAMQQGKPGRRSSTRSSTCSRSTASRCVDLPLDGAPRAARGSCSTRAQQTVQLSGVFDDGEALFEAANEQGLEGVMAKRRGSRYLEGKRTRDWLKIKTHGRQEFVICGYTKGQGRRARQLRLARARRRTAAASCVWVGNVRHRASPSATIDELLAKLEPLARDDVAVRGRAEDAEGAQGRRRLGRAEARRARSSSPSGRTTGTCARRRSRVCATTRRRARCSARIRSSGRRRA